VGRPFIIRLVGLALWTLVLVSTAGGQADGGHRPVTGAPPPAVVGALSAASDAAVVPPRAADELRVAATASPLRILVVAAVLAVLVGLPAVLRRSPAAVGGGSRPLRARRYAITLRAPPLQLT
jgi:hypothetical protein